MKKNILLIINTALLLALFSNNAFSQDTPATQGKEFWVAFGLNMDRTYNGTGENELKLQIRIVAEKATTGTIRFTQSAGSRSFSVPAGGVYTYDLTVAEKEWVYASRSEITTNPISSKSLYITSTENVSVYAISLSKFSTDATGIYPVTSYGTSYYALSYRASNYSDGFVIVANENNTIIRDNGSQIATLNRGQVYRYYGSLYSLFTGRNIITSDKPVAFFSAAQGVQIPQGTSYVDCLFEQLLPVHTWGMRFLVPVTRRGIERVRIIASQDGTIITQTGGTVMTNVAGGAVTTLSSPLNAGQFVELEINIANNGCYIQSNKPVAVASFLMGSQYPDINIDSDATRGDPAMAWIPSIEQTIENVIIAPFMAAGSSLIAEHHALIMVPTATRNATTVAIGTGANQSLSGGTWTTNTSSGHSFYSMPLTQNSAYHFKNTSGLTVLGYGLGRDESYYYLAGSALRGLNADFYINDIHHNNANGQAFCSGFTVRADILFPMAAAAGRLRWYINNQEISVQDQLEWSLPTLPSGTHTIKMVAKSLDNREITVESTITVSGAINAGAIGGNQNICYGSSAATITSTTAASGGTGLTYNWQQSTDGTTWTNATGTRTNATYNPPALTTTMHYRRQATTSCGTAETSSVTITITDAVNAGAIGSSQNICSASTPAMLTSTTNASGGIGAITYNWQQSTNGTTWTNATNTRTNATYSPGTLTATTHYRRQATNSCGTENSNSVTITISSALVAGSIGGTQTICSGATASTLTSTTAASGGSGTVTYNWQQSTNGTTCTNATGTRTNATYSPGTVSTITHYRRSATGMDCNGSSNTVTSNVIIITVAENISAGAIGSNQSICSGNAAATLTSTTAASGGTGALTYRWQSSTNGTSWTDITGTAAANATYSPGVVSTTTHYRRNVTGTNCNGSTATVSSNAVIVTVTAAIVAGSIGGSGQNICAGDIPNTLTSTTAASGGTGTLTYRWQSSPNGTSWGNITGTEGAGATYSPGAISATTHYRRTVTGLNCGGSNATVNSNVIVVTVSPLAPPTMIKIQ